MAFTPDKCRTVGSLSRRVQGCGKRRKVGNAFVPFHPRRRIVAAVQPLRRLATMGGHRVQQRIDPDRRQAGLRQIDAVIDIDEHLFGQHVGQWLQAQGSAIGGVQVQGLRVRAFDLGDGQNVVPTARRRGRIDHGAGGLARHVRAV